MDDLLSLIKHPLTDTDRARIAQAYDVASKYHTGQTRNSGEPYVEHSLAVAKNCAELGMDIDTIIGALLHDVLEDTDATEDEIRELFGESILFLVKGVTKLGKLKYQGKDRHVESLRKFFVAIAEDLRVLIIKLADRLHNVSTLEHVRADKRRRIALETIEVHAALAGRLGMEHLKGMLEDYAFPYAYPDEYTRTTAIMADLVPESQSAITSAHTQIEQTLRDFDIPNATVSSRIKHTYSTYRKLAKYKWNTELVYDIVALRVLVPTITDCYHVLGLIHMLWKPIPKRIKDYIALPKPNGYQSIHTTVITEHGVVELQIRTHEMHQEAELGVASHFAYKESQFAKNAITKSKKFNWIDELKELHSVVNDPSRFLEELKLDFFTNRIFVFTPQGDVIDLPEGASPIDVAYAIHSEIGERASGAKANGKMIGLGDTLHNGDIVEIQTSKHAHPGTKWLEYAKTSFARKKIRHYLDTTTKSF